MFFQYLHVHGRMTSTQLDKSSHQNVILESLRLNGIKPPCMGDPSSGRGFFYTVDCCGNIYYSVLEIKRLGGLLEFCVQLLQILLCQLPQAPYWRWPYFGPASST